MGVNIQRAGHKKPTSFGACRTAQDILRYAQTEGFPIGKAQCVSCGCKWTMIITPNCNLADFNKALVPGQPCIRCKEESVQVLSVKKS